MSETVTLSSYATYLVPAQVVQRQDVAHLLDEVEKISNILTEQEVRQKTGEEIHDTPVLSEALSAFLDQNHFSLIDPLMESQQRTELIQQLRLLKEKAPVIHMTFAVEADKESLEQLVLWFRQEIHPQALLSVGIQPALVAGTYVRTPNKVHDWSLRGRLIAQREQLETEIGALHGTNE